MGAFSGPSPSGSSGERTDPTQILPPGERKAAMSTLDQLEAKWTLGAFVLATVAGIAIPAYFIAENKVIALDTFLDQLSAPVERIFGTTLLGAQAIQTINRFPKGLGSGGAF